MGHTYARLSRSVKDNNLVVRISKNLEFGTFHIIRLSSVRIVHGYCTNCMLITAKLSWAQIVDITAWNSTPVFGRKRKVLALAEILC